jgi:putative AlgH/UPF0301 family transcriptional regulator
VSTIFDDQTRRQVAFTALRELNKKLSYYEILSENAPQIVPQQAAWQVSALPFHPPASYLRPGAFLVSHPFMNDSFFSKTVIIILDHTPIIPQDDPSKGEHDEQNDRIPDDGNIQQPTTYPGQTYGLIINRVSVDRKTGKNRTLEDAFQENLLPARVASVFGDSTVREGGPVHTSLQMIHSLSSSSSSSSDQEDVASLVGGTIIPTITDDEEQSPALYSDRATYFKGNIFKAMNAIDDGTLDRGRLFCISNVFKTQICFLVR